MKKIKPKKRQGATENEVKPSNRLEGPGKEGEVAEVPKIKDKASLKKIGPKEEAEEGLASKWAGKVPWIGLTRDFFREVRIELRKVTWPSRKETIAATAMVLILSGLVALFLGLLDVGLSKAVGILLNR